MELTTKSSSGPTRPENSAQANSNAGLVQPYPALSVAKNQVCGHPGASDILPFALMTSSP